MPCYPDITSPCPVADRLDEVMEGDFCRRCSKRVADLDTMGHADRYRLMAKTGGDVCLRYRLPGSAALAAAAMVAAGIAVPAAASAQDTVVVSSDTDPGMYDEIVVGGARKLTRQERYQMERQARAEERREKRLKRRAEKAAPPAS